MNPRELEDAPIPVDLEQFERLVLEMAVEEAARRVLWEPYLEADDPFPGLAHLLAESSHGSATAD